MLKIHTRNFGDVAILYLQGRVVNGETTVLSRAVNSQVDAHLVVLDLARVNTIDAHGLGVLLGLREQTLSKGIEFKLMNLTKPVVDVMEITRLNTVFEVVSGAEWKTIVTLREASMIERASRTIVQSRNLSLRRQRVP
jgi:anti-anti-sigma factor